MPAPYRSTDGGVNWTETNAGLPNTALSDVAFSPFFAIDQTAYVTTRNGELYRSRDGGVSWTLVGSAPDQPTFYDVQVNQQGTVFVSTSQGVWQYTTPAQDILINGGFEASGGWELPIRLTRPDTVKMWFTMANRQPKSASSMMATHWPIHQRGKQ